jgi:hypothetical protein
VLLETPARYRAPHWFSQLLTTAPAAGGAPISHVTISRIWHRFGVRPWRSGALTFSTDPELEDEIRDVVGLALHPPGKAVVLRGREAAAEGPRADRTGAAGPAPLPGTSDLRLPPVGRHRPSLPATARGGRQPRHPRAPAVRAWLARHPRVTLHVTPTSGSWLNLVETFSSITRQALRRGSFPHRRRPHPRHSALHGSLERPLRSVAGRSTAGFT